MHIISLQNVRAMVFPVKSLEFDQRKPIPSIALSSLSIPLAQPAAFRMEKLHKHQSATVDLNLERVNRA